MELLSVSKEDTPTSLDFQIQYMDACSQLNENPHFCSSTLSNPDLLEIRLLDVSISEGSENDIDEQSFLVYSLEMMIPIENRNYAVTESGKVHNVGFFNNGNFQKFGLPVDYVNIHDRIFNLNRQKCHRNICHIGALSISPDSRCLEGLLDKSKSDCQAEVLDFVSPCNMATLKSGTLVSARNADFYKRSELKHRSHPFKISNNTAFITTGGALTCSDSEFYLHEPNEDKSYSLYKNSEVLGEYQIDFSDLIELKVSIEKFQEETKTNITKIGLNTLNDKKANDKLDFLQTCGILFILILCIFIAFIVPFCLKKRISDMGAKLKDHLLPK